VPCVAAWGSGGQFSSALQPGGALGVAVIGTTVFFAELETESFTDSFTQALPVAAGLFLIAAAVAPVLPPTAVSEEEAEAVA
jgi:hypothetical protein